MSKTQYFLGAEEWPGVSKVVEESGELLQVYGKLIGNEGQTIHFSGVDLMEKFIEECADVKAALEFFIDTNLNEERKYRLEIRSGEKYATFYNRHHDRLNQK